MASRLRAGPVERAMQRHRRYADPAAMAAKRLPRRTSAVGWKLQRFNAGELLAPVLDLIVQHQLCKPSSLPRGKVGILQGETAECRRLGARKAGIERCQLFIENADRPLVNNDVVHDEEKDVFMPA